MKAYHFELKDGELGTLAACPDNWSDEQARELLEFRFPGRVMAIREAGHLLGFPIERKRMEELKRAARGQKPQEISVPTYRPGAKRRRAPFLDGGE